MADSICIGHGENLGLGQGGTVRVVSLAQSLEDFGYDVHLVAPKVEDTVTVPDGLESVTFHPVQISTRGAIDQLPRAALISKRAKSVAEDHDAILQLERGTLAGVATYLGISEYVVDLHDIGFNGPLYTSLPLASFVQRFVYHMERRGVQRASEVIAVSSKMADFVCSEWGVSGERVHVVPNGVRSSVLDIEPSNVEKDGQVSFIGSLNYNIDYKKIVNLAQAIDGIEIHVIGDGYNRDDLAEEIEEQNIENIVVHGFLPDSEAYRILAQSQVCIFPLVDSHHTTVAQHMKGFDYGALGKAIATDRDSTAEILDQNNAALVSDPGNPEEFVANVRRLMGDRELRDTLGKNARRIAEEHRWERQGEKLVRILDQRC